MPVPALMGGNRLYGYGKKSGEESYPAAPFTSPSPIAALL